MRSGYGGIGRLKRRWRGRHRALPLHVFGARWKVERELRLAVLRAERDELFRLARLRELPNDLVRRLLRELDLIETPFTS